MLFVCVFQVASFQWAEGSRDSYSGGFRSGSVLPRMGNLVLDTVQAYTHIIHPSKQGCWLRPLFEADLEHLCSHTANELDLADECPKVGPWSSGPMYGNIFI